MERRRAPPTVSVPVLSNRTVWARASARNERNRSRQYERTWSCSDQHCEAANEIARNQQCDRGYCERAGKKDQRVAIGKPHERRLGGLCRRYEAHDARIGAFAGDR